MVTRPDDQFQRHRLRLCRVPITRDPVKLVQQPVTRIRAGSNGKGCHEKHVIKSPGLILERHFPTVAVGPGNAIAPDSRCQSDLQLVMSSVKCYEELEDE